MKLQTLDIAELKAQLTIYRDDENHPTVSGNKFHKLTPNLKLAQEQACSTILSFGGAYSNHLHALAFACEQKGLASIGFVRGELHTDLTPTLQDCQAWGMRLIAMPRKPYRQLQEIIANNKGITLVEDLLAAFLAENIESDKHSFLTKLFSDIPQNTIVVPEGGSNLLAIESLAAAYQPLFDPSLSQGSAFTHAVCATGTGATLAGLRKAAPKEVTVIGVQAVAEGDATKQRIQAWLGDGCSNDFHKSYEGEIIIKEGHLGGFAKMPSDLLHFIDEFESQHQIPLDPVYNGKVLYKLKQMADDGFFSAGDKVLIIHTGGLQGKRGIA